MPGTTIPNQNESLSTLFKQFKPESRVLQIKFISGPVRFVPESANCQGG